MPLGQHLALGLKTSLQINEQSVDSFAPFLQWEKSLDRKSFVFNARSG